jgi:hypothetical protein
MKKHLSWLVLFLFLAVLFFAAGCSEREESSSPVSVDSSPATGSGGHNSSVLGVVKQAQGVQQQMNTKAKRMTKDMDQAGSADE